MTMRWPILLALLAALAAGCATLPESGPVVTTQQTTSADGQPGLNAAAISARAPVPGMTGTEVVQGFLDALQAWPAELSTAKQYLASDVQSSWQPRGTVVYSESQQPAGSSSRVSVRFYGAARLDARGAWKGSLPTRDSTLRFRLVEQDGELRITNPPSSVLVPRAWFEQRYASVGLYYLDPTGDLVVPEPVFVGEDDKFASTLIADLLRGPGTSLRNVVTTAIPAGLKVDLSVPVSDGTAQVTLTGGSTTLAGDQLEQVLTQLSWTLRQVPDVERFTLSIGGRAVRDDGGRTRFSVNDGAPYDPTGTGASSQLFGLLDGRLVSGEPGGLSYATGALGQQQLGVRSVGVDLFANRAAAVTDDGTSVIEGSVSDPDTGADTVVSDATDLLPPAFDYRGRMWLLDRTDTGAVITWRRGQRNGTVDVPGITGQQVSQFLVSRDGTRLVAVVQGPGADRVVVSRVRVAESGKVIGATRAVRLPLEDQAGAGLLDVAWTSPTTLVVLNRITGQSSKVITVGVDGSPGGLAQSPGAASRDDVSTSLTGARGLIGTPVTSDPVYAVLSSGLVDLGARARGVEAVKQGVDDLDYVG
ncbi:LpqB family beta-propeller domain-containing protein [Nocardioides acrostichi]|uniref:GerMN domain-containing protein n=1 Tax=Nocardioides acrostichi TaxID=2784339 RepID=A0A930Y7D0_9ACTN|nr:LpqB family beta-propeller domain-containing protein [Nocardioides acrostichi]MBF4161871.1 GerMN domain-containing protein [Nocardioides acrostichi]